MVSHLTRTNPHRTCGACRGSALVPEPLVRRFLSSMTASVQLNAHKTFHWLISVFFTVRRRNGVTVSEVSRSARQDTPYCGWRRALPTQRTGGTHFRLVQCAAAILQLHLRNQTGLQTRRCTPELSKPRSSRRIPAVLPVCFESREDVY